MLHVTEAELDDLRARLRNTRWAEPWPDADWDTGTEGDHLRRLVDHWATGYDWRKQEAAINALPWGTADIDGNKIHFLRYGSAEPALLLANGWPSSFLELTGLAERLAADFTVIVPLLPGYAQAPQRTGHLHIHQLWHRLMRDELGFERYAAHGSDIGAGEVSRLAEAYPEALIGIHVLDTADPQEYDPAGLTDDERAFLAAKKAWHDTEGGYSHEQGTRPLTLAQGLSDSPSGLLAWILEKYQRWSDDFSRFDDDFLLTQASLYWFTNSISTSFRPYFERRQQIVPLVGPVRVPTAVALFPGDIGGAQPRSWVERNYDVARYTVMPRGGHFAAYEETELLADDITAFLVGRS
jgi:pimeloyl-ACP methyl ester carboxylesterase